MTEAELKQAVLRIARLNGWMYHYAAQNRIVRPQKDFVGFPDIVLARDGQVLFMELKQDDGAQSPGQVAWQGHLPAYHVIRPRDLDRVMELLA